MPSAMSPRFPNPGRVLIETTFTRAMGMVKLAG